jgi:hypothetical protein
MSFWASIAGAVVGGLFQAKAAKEQRKQAIADQDQQFVRMRDAAEKAGFNPLTALRFTGLPTFSKYAAFGNVAMGITDAFINRPIDKYNKEVRDLEIKQRKANIDNTISNTAYTGILANQARAANVDPYAGYDKYIPVRVGNNIQQLEISVAKRLGIEPNGALIPEDLTALKGELRGEAEAIIANEVADKVLIPAPLTGTAATLQNTPPRLASNFDMFVGKITNLINSMPSTPVIPPLSDKRWNEEWKNYVN